MKILEVRDMNISINLNGVLTSIIGNNNSGKTYFLKKLINKISSDQIYLDDIKISQYDITFLKNNIFAVFDDDTFKCEYVAEELFFYLNLLGYTIDEITSKIQEIINFFHLSSYENKRIESLNVSMRALIKILAMLICNPKIFAIDNLFPYLSKTHQELIIKYIKKNRISLINVITDGEYLKYTDEVVVLNEGTSIFRGKVQELLSSNSILPYMGIRLPFVVELSNNLILYGLVDKVYYDNSKLVNKLWK